MNTVFIKIQAANTHRVVYTYIDKRGTEVGGTIGVGDTIEIPVEEIV